MPRAKGTLSCGLTMIVDPDRLGGVFVGPTGLRAGLLLCGLRTNAGDVFYEGEQREAEIVGNTLRLRATIDGVGYEGTIRVDAWEDGVRFSVEARCRPPPRTLGIFPDLAVCREDGEPAISRFRELLAPRGVSAPLCVVELPTLGLLVIYLEDLGAICKAARAYGWRLKEVVGCQTLNVRGRPAVVIGPTTGEGACRVEEREELIVHRAEIAVIPKLPHDPCEAADLTLRALSRMLEVPEERPREEIFEAALAGLRALSKAECWRRTDDIELPLSCPGEPATRLRPATAARILVGLRMLKTSLGAAGELDGKVERGLLAAVARGRLDELPSSEAVEDLMSELLALVYLGKACLMGTDPGGFLNACERLRKLVEEAEEPRVSYDRGRRRLVGRRYEGLLGALAYALIIAHELTGRAEYLEEAGRLLDRLCRRGLGDAWDPEVEAIALAACCRYAAHTGADVHRATGQCLLGLLSLSLLWSPPELPELRGSAVEGSGMMALSSKTGWAAFWLTESTMLAARAPAHLRRVMEIARRLARRALAAFVREGLPAERALLMNDATRIIGCSVEAAAAAMAIHVAEEIAADGRLRLPAQGVLELAGVQLGRLSLPLGAEAIIARRLTRAGPEIEAELREKAAIVDLGSGELLEREEGERRLRTGNGWLLVAEYTPSVGELELRAKPEGLELGIPEYLGLAEVIALDLACLRMTRCWALLEAGTYNIGVKGMIRPVAVICSSRKGVMVALPERKGEEK